ncbi:MAG: hypothetical protein EA420_00890 [Candidatus Competibacteraceae bacterium]|nr:MAG: hypothetical protein EA420_00890 [Candidatus Competibacteraceae bacterium]
MEEPTPYRIGPAALPEPAPTTDDLVTQAHARRQGIPYETGERLLEQLPERLRALADLVLSGKMQGGEVAYALAVLIDSIENARSAQ